MAPERSGYSARLAIALSAAAVARPRTVLCITAILIVASVAYATTSLRYKTQRNDLVSAEKECQKRWQRYLDAFGDDDDCVFIIQGDDRSQMIAAVEALASRLKHEPEHFDRIFHAVDLRTLRSRSLQYATRDQLQQIDSKLDDLAPLLGPLSPFGWHVLSLESLLGRAVSRNVESRADQRLQEELPGILKAAVAELTLSPSVPIWSSEQMTDQRLDEPHYFFTPDQRLAIVLARARMDVSSFTPAHKACVAARAVLADIRPQFPSLEFGLTGLPVLETDEMVSSDQDTTRASLLALAGVALLYIVVYRGIRYPLLTLGTLLTGTALALGWAALTVGHLNILSAAFAVMLIGLGDFGVIWVAHYEECRRRGCQLDEALETTAARAGPGVVAAALTTALAFGATMLADFQAVAELGWIAGWGVLFCGLASLTLLPVLMTLSAEKRDLPRNILPFPKPEQAFLPAVTTRPRITIMLAILTVMVMAFGLARLEYDANLLHLQAEGLDSVRWEERLIQHSAGTTWDALSIATGQDEALRLKAAYEQTPGVGRVVEAASLLPVDYESKRDVLVSIRRKLDGLPPTVPEFSLVTSAQVESLLSQLSGAESQTLRAAISALPPEIATSRLRTFDARLRRELHAKLMMLRNICDPARITLEDLPAAFRERYVAPNGAFLVRAFAAESLWDLGALSSFTQAAQSVDPDATGKSFRTLEGLQQMKKGFLRAGLVAIAVIVVVLWFDFRSAQCVLLGLLPLAAGLVVALGLLGWTGISLNPANLIALPLIVGVGVDNGIHVLHDFLDRPRTERYRLRAGTGRGIAVTALTTLLGFGTLMLARHQGLASLGLTLALGVGTCMLAALVILPALLSLLPVKSVMYAPVISSIRPRKRVAA